MSAASRGRGPRAARGGGGGTARSSAGTGAFAGAAAVARAAPARGGFALRRANARARGTSTRQEQHKSYTWRAGSPDASPPTPGTLAAARDPTKNTNRAQYMKHMGDLFQKLKDSRESERKVAIRDGFLADPEKKTTLAEAITPVGTCQDMCPEFERVERIVQHAVDKCERRTLDDDSKVAWEAFMIKRFRRSAAGTDDQIPSDIRPPLVLKRTLDYLLNSVVGGSEPLANVHKFVWDRTRAIRNDFSIQQVTKVEDLKIAIECFERIARFHLLSLHQLSHPTRDNGDFDSHQEREQLGNTLLSLMYYYDDSRKKFASPNEAEFRAYGIILEIHDRRPDIEHRVQNWPKSLLEDRRIQTALRLHAAASNTDGDQGPLNPRTPFLIAQGNFGRFWAIVRSNSISYLAACAAEIYFNFLRSSALGTIYKSYRRPSPAKLDDMTLDVLTGWLGFDTEDQTQTFCEEHGFSVKEKESGVAWVDLSSVSTRWLNDSNSTRGQIFSRRLVEAKRHGRTLPAVIKGYNVARCKAEGLIETLDDEYHKDASLFLSDDEQDKTSIAQNPFNAFSTKTLATSTPEESGRNPFQPKASKPSPFAATSLLQAETPSNPFSQIPTGPTNPFSKVITHSIKPNPSDQSNPFATAGTVKADGRAQANPFASLVPKVSSGGIPSSSLADSQVPESQTKASSSGAFVPEQKTLFSAKIGLQLSHEPEQTTKSEPLTEIRSLPEIPTTNANVSNKSHFQFSSSSSSTNPEPTIPPRFDAINERADTSTGDGVSTWPGSAAAAATTSPASVIPAKKVHFSVTDSQSVEEHPKSAGLNVPGGPFPSSQGLSGSPDEYSLQQQRTAEEELLRKQQSEEKLLREQEQERLRVQQERDRKRQQQEKEEAQRIEAEKRQAMENLSRAYTMVEKGVLDMFIQSILQPIAEKYVKKVACEKERALAAEARQQLLSVKYFRRWRTITYNRSLTRNAKARRRRLAEAREQSRASFRSSRATSIASSEFEPLGSLIRPSVTSVPPESPTSPDLRNSAKRKSLPHDIQTAAHGMATIAISSPSRSPSAKRPRDNRHSRSLTSDAAHFARPERQRQDALLSHSTDRLVYKQVLPNEALLKKARRLVTGRTDTTQTDYFRLKAMGVSPDTSVVPESRKRPRTSDQNEESSRKASRASPPRPTAIERWSRSTSRVGEPVASPAPPPPPLFHEKESRRDDDENDDDELLAKVRTVRRAMAESEAWFRSTRQDLEAQEESARPQSAQQLEREERLRSLESTPSRTSVRHQTHGSHGYLERWEQIKQRRIAEAAMAAADSLAPPASAEPEVLWFGSPPPNGTAVTSVSTPSKTVVNGTKSAAAAGPVMRTGASLTAVPFASRASPFGGGSGASADDAIEL